MIKLFSRTVAGDDGASANRANSHLTDVLCVKDEYPHRNSGI